MCTQYLSTQIHKANIEIPEEGERIQYNNNSRNFKTSLSEMNTCLAENQQNQNYIAH